jgi:hypothetical protein
MEERGKEEIFYNIILNSIKAIAYACDDSRFTASTLAGCGSPHSHP